ncbi:hypothetical protein FXW78_10035 [Rhodococcus opacus]|nr:hypothetical protein [Rhodococcus opacus]
MTVVESVVGDPGVRAKQHGGQRPDVIAHVLDLEHTRPGLHPHRILLQFVDQTLPVAQHPVGASAVQTGTVTDHADPGGTGLAR